MPPRPQTRRAPARREGEPSTAGESEAAGAAPESSTSTSTSTQQNPNPNPTPSSTTSSTRPPVQRLQSLKKRTPGSAGSLIPPTTTTTTTTRDGSSATPKPTLKYQPKVVNRRSKEERDARERLEAERQKERIKEAAAVQRSNPNANVRGMGDRGRGGAGPGRGRGRGGVTVGGGIDGPSGFRGGEGRMRGGMGGGAGGGGGRVKSEYGHLAGTGRKSKATSVVRSGKGSRVVSRDVSSDEGEDFENKISIENINVVSESDDEGGELGGDTKGKGKAKGKQRAGTSAGVGRGLRPVRVERHEHVDRVVTVNTEEDSNKSAELRRKAKEAARDDDSDLFVRDDDEPATTAEEGGQARSTSTEPQVKEEPTDGDVVMTDDIPHARDVEPKVSTPKEHQTKSPEPDAKTQRRQGEDDLEWEIQQSEIDMLKTTLGSIDLQPKVATTTDEEGQDVKSEVEQPVNPRDGRLFLIQFPPKTPNLTIPNDPAVGEAEPDESQPTASSPPTGGIGIKKEDRGSTTNTPNPVPAKDDGGPSNYVTAKSKSLPAGYVGKLNLHKSGRVTLDWGGIPFELNMGTEVDFLQDAVVTSSPSTDLTGDTAAEEKKVWAMSQVTGKFVVTPDWDKLLG